MDLKKEELVNFELLVKGDTLLAGRIPQIDKNTKLAIFTPGEQLVVLKTLPAGVIVQSTAKDKPARRAEYHFEMGASKLNYTTDTVAAITKRAALLAQEAEQNKPFDAQAQIAALAGNVGDLKALVSAMAKQNASLMQQLAAAQGLPQQQQQQQQQPPQGEAQAELPTGDGAQN